jgi:L-ascorbate metabolism protein UlaG (beta-lactamase superfamily)
MPGASQESSPDAPGEHLTFVGHSTVLLEIGGVRVLTDPILRDRVLHIRRHAGAVAPDVVERIDAVLISHLHPDHLDPPSIRKLGRETRILAPAGSARLLRRYGFKHVDEVAAGDGAEIGGARINAVPVEHDGRRYPIGPRVQALGYEIQGASTVFFAGDTAPFDMSNLTGIDVALLPIAGWGPNLREAHHLDARLAAEAAAAIGPRVAVPIHWGTMLRMGLGDRAHEILVHPAEKFTARMAELAPGVEARVLQPGESMPL